MLAYTPSLQRLRIKEEFKIFYQKYSYMELEQAIEYFSLFGGIKEPLSLNYFDDIFSMIQTHFSASLDSFECFVSPSYLMGSPYQDLLIAIAKGDGKIHSVFRKARLNPTTGEVLVKELCALDILRIEYSREAPLKVHPKHKLPKDQRAYRIQDKLRFKQPFLRFWFGFVSSYREELLSHHTDAFFIHFTKHYERLRSLVYEQLCNDVLLHYYEDKERILSSGSYWNIHSEFDILAVTKSKKIILGECKYKDRTVCKNELTKLKQKAVESGIKVDVYALFSKSGFSKELLSMKSESLLLFDLDDLKVLL